MIKIVFFGTPEYVIPILEKLYKNFKLIAVVTQEPKKSGRDQLLTYSAVDEFAYRRKISILFDPLEVPQAELGVCAAYGKIIPKNVIEKFKYGILNIHPSLLPKYRGATPTQGAIASGDTVSGVSIIKMDEKMDHGPIVTQFKEEVLPNDTGASLRNRLFERSADVLVGLIPNYIKGKINVKSQDETKATFTKVLNKEDGFIDLKGKTQEELDRFARAMYPWPGAWTKLPDGKRLKILPNNMVQLEGKNPVTQKQFEEAYSSLNLKS